MKKLKSVGQYFVALALAAVISVGAVTPAHAASATVGSVVAQAAISGAVGVLTQKLFDFVDESLSLAERNEALSVIHNYWVDDSLCPFDDTYGCVQLKIDDLYSIAADLTMRGFPCEVVSYEYTNAGGVYSYVWVIKAVGWMYVPGEVESEFGDGGFGGGDPAFSILGRYFTIDGQWLYAESDTSSSVLRNFYNKFIDFGNAIIAQNELLDARIALIKGYIYGFDDDPEVPSIMSRLEDLITAVENLSVVGGGDVNLDTSPITKKLDSVISAINTKGTSIVTAINEFDPGTSKVIASIVTNTAIIKNAIDDISFDTSSVVNAINTKGTSIVNAVNDISFDTSSVVNAINTKGTSIVEEMVYISEDEIVQWYEIRDSLLSSIEDSASSRDTLLNALIEAVEGNTLTLDVDSLSISGLLFDTSPITDAIENYHDDFNEYFAQFGQNIDYGEKELSFTGTQEYYWNSNSQSYISGSLSSGSTVNIYRVPDVTDGLGGVSSGYPHVVDRDGLPVILPSTTDRFPGVLNFIYDGVRRQISFDEVYGSGFASGQQFNVFDTGEFTEVYDAFFFGRTTQSGTPSMSSPVSLNNVFTQNIDGTNCLQITLRNRDFSQERFVRVSVPFMLEMRGIPVNAGGNFMDENGQQWLCDVFNAQDGTFSQYVGSVTLDGSDDEKWYSYNWTQKGYYCIIPGISPDFVLSRQHGALSTHFAYDHSVESKASAVGFNVKKISGSNYGPIFCSGDMFPTLTDFKAWLSDNPVTVYYALAEPQVTQFASSDFKFEGCKAFPEFTHFESNCFVNVYYDSCDPVSSIYVDADGIWYYGHKSGESYRVFEPSNLAVLRDAFNVRTYSNADSVVFNEGMNHISVSNNGQFDMTVLQGNKIIMWYVNWAHSSRSFLEDKLTSLESTLSKLDSGDVDIDIENNTNIDINNDNDSYNVFYVTDPETGEETSIIDLTGNVLTAFGKLLNFLYQIGFEDALSNFGDTVDGLTDFYLDSSVGSVDVWVS